MEQECLSTKVKSVRVPSYSEARAKVLRLYREPVSLGRSVRRKGVVKVLAKVDRIYSYVDKEVFGCVDRIMRPEELNEFYAEILALAGIRDYKDLFFRLKGLRKAFRRMWKTYRLRIKESITPKEANDKGREFVGRVISFLRRVRKDLDRLRVALEELRRVPCIDFTQPKIVVAGMPQVGKSTLIRRVSTAKPEVSPFPFTTKEVILGHSKIDHLTLQFIDTPGILDRPLKELNRIERKAVTAIRFLADVLLFLIDPRESSYYSLNDQLGLLRNVQGLFPGELILVLINKADETPKERLRQVMEEVRNVFDGEVYVVSALTGMNIDKVIERVASHIKGKYLYILEKNRSEA